MWTIETNPLDQYVYGVCWASDLAEFLAVGQDSGVTEALIRSADGSSWIYQASPFDGGVGNAAVRDIFHGITVAAGRTADAADAFITSPDNSTWTGRGNPFLGAAYGFGAAVRESDGALLVAGGSGATPGLAVSTDDGVTWTGLVLPADTFSTLQCAAIRSSDDLLLIGGNPLDLYYFPASDYAAVSSDGGATWLTTRPFGDGGAVYGCAVRDSDGALVVAGADGSGYAKVGVSNDDGATWTTYAPFGILATSGLAGVAVRQSDDALIVVGNDNGNVHHLAISTDGGTTWTPRVPFDVGGFASGVAVRSSDDAILVVGTDSSSSVQFAVSTNSGLTWTTSAVGLIGIGLGVAVRDSDDLILVGGTGDDSIATSIDGGGTWVVSSTFAGGYGAGAAFRQGDGALLVAGSFAGGVIQTGVSTDDGTSWTTAGPLSLPVGTALCVACKQSNGALVAGGDYTAVRTIAVSSDAGVTWTAVPSPFDGGGQVSAIDYSVADDTWFASGVDAAGTAPLVAFSTDDGATWTALAAQPPMAYNFNNFYPRVYRDEPNGAWWVVGQTTGNHAAAVSADGGSSWTEVTTPLDDAALVGGAMAILNTGAAMALVGVDALNTKQMCVSTDAGSTWEFDATPSPFGDIGSPAAVTLAYSSDLDLAVAGGYGAAGTVASGLPTIPASFTTDSPVSIIGAPAVGAPLVSSPGTYTPVPTSRSYQWQRCDAGGGSCVDIDGETSSSYTPVPEDLGHTLRIIETVSKDGYFDSGATSDPVGFPPPTYGVWTDAVTPFDGSECRGVCWDLDNDVFVAAGNGGPAFEVLLTSPDGASWIARTSPLDGAEAFAVARSTPNGVTVAVGSDSNYETVIVTSPDNIDWTDRGNPFLGFGKAYGVAIRDSDDAILIAGADWSSGGLANLAISTDDGASWSLILAGDRYLSARGVAVRAADDLLLVVGFAVGGGGVHTAAVSTDGGATWPTLTDPLGSGSAVYGCAVRDSDGALVVVGLSSSNIATMAISTDDGATWTTHQPFGATAGSRAYSVAVFSSTIVVVGRDATGAKQLAYSTNSGSTWTTRAPFGAGGQAFAIHFGGSGQFYIAGQTSGATSQLAFSSDNGASWVTYQPFGALGEARGVAASSKFFVSGFPFGGGQVAVNTSPFLTSWAITSPFGSSGGGAGAVAVRASDGLVVVVRQTIDGGTGGSDTQVAISNDDTDTWTLSSPFNVPAGRGSAVACNPDSGVVVAGSASSSGYALARSTDGLTYESISSPFNYGDVGGIDYSPDEGRWMAAGLIFGTAVVAYSDDDGLTWTEILTHPMDSSFGVTPTVYRDEANGNWYLLGQTTGSRALAVSDNGGSTWTELPTPLDPVAGVGQANAMANCGGVFALGGIDPTGQFQMAASFDGMSWAPDSGNDTPFGEAGTAYGLAYSDSLVAAVVAGVA